MRATPVHAFLINSYYSFVSECIDMTVMVPPRRLLLSRENRSRWGDTLDAFGTNARALSVFHHAQQPGSGLFRPVFGIVQTGFHWSASALFTLYCALQNDLGPGVQTVDVAMPRQFPSLDRGKEWFQPAV